MDVRVAMGEDAEAVVARAELAEAVVATAEVMAAGTALARVASGRGQECSLAAAVGCLGGVGGRSHRSARGR